MNAINSVWQMIVLTEIQLKPAASHTGSDEPSPLEESIFQDPGQQHLSGKKSERLSSITRAGLIF